MKNRRKFVVAILLAAVVCIGAGYAAIAGTITGEGTVTYTPNFAIQWGEEREVTIKGFSNNAQASNVTDIKVEEGVLKFSVDTTDWVINDDYVTITAKVKNTSKYDAENVTATVNSTTNINSETNNYYEVTIACDSTIAAGSEIGVSITVKMVKYPQVAADSKFEQAFQVTVTANQKITVES